jgi:peptidyl-prolyl cis-trans isomerase B (cyclophilin B)
MQNLNSDSKGVVKMRSSRKTSITVFSLVLSMVSSLVCGISALAAKSPDPTVVLETTKGKIKVEIYKNDVPKTADNFLDLVSRNFYNGVSFHRYEPGFCIQGGDPKGTGGGGFIDPKTHQERTIELETSPAMVQSNPKLKHSSAGVLAMARTDNPNSASSQFYFTLGPANFLDGKYAVFGKVKDGLDVVMALRAGDKMTKVYVQQ